MKHKEIFKKIRPIFSDLFKIKLDEINYEDNRDSIDHWDSLNHLILIMKIEEAVSMKFNIESINELNSISSIIDEIEKKINAN